MAGTELFRTSFVGGYNKADVMEYVKKLEDELEHLRTVKEKAAVLEKSVSELLEKQEVTEKKSADSKKDTQKTSSADEQDKRFLPVDWLPDSMSKEEFVELRDKARKYDESYDAIKKLLLDSRIEAQVILKDAKMKADKIVKDAEANAIEKSRESEMHLLMDAQLKAMKIIQDAEKKAAENTKEAKKLIAVEIKDSAGQLQEEIKAIQDSMQFMVDQLPARMEQRMKERFLSEKNGDLISGDGGTLGEDL